MDALGDLCLAAVEDAEQENRGINDHHNELSNHVNLSEKNPDAAEAKTSSDRLVDLYKAQCRTEGVGPFQDHISTLAEIPEQLIVHASECQIIKRVTGGAVIKVSGGCPLQISALLTTVAPPKDATILAVVDTLDLSNVKVTEGCLSKMIDNALMWGPWWKLRCLVLKNCGLGLQHLKVLASAGAVPCFWNLEYLDISHNFDIGLNTSGFIRDPEEFAGADIALLIHLWKHTKLRRLNIEQCHLGVKVLTCLITMLRKYHAPSMTLECGFALHSGTKPVLECLVLGNPMVGTQSDEVDNMETLLSNELISLIKELPKISFIGISGISNAFISRIREAWEVVCDKKQKIETSQGCHQGLHLASFDESTLNIPAEHILPESYFDLEVEQIEDRSSPQLPKQLLDDFGLNSAIQKPAAANDVEAVKLVVTNKFDKYSLNIISPRHNSKSSSKRRTRENDGSIKRKSGKTGQQQHAVNDNRLYKGGDRNDILPLEEIEISSNSDERSSSLTSQATKDGETSSESERFDRCVNVGGNATEPPPAPRVHDPVEKFKLRDGILDEDSRLGKMYRADARKNILKIPKVEHQRAAKRAFKLWDQCTENSWDRRRWDNPSKTQNDEPHILGQLNLLFDLLDMYKLGIGFPFPLWRKGQGEHAFEIAVDKNHAEAAKDTTNHKHQRRQTSTHNARKPVELEPVSFKDDHAGHERIGKGRAFILSSDEDEENSVDPNEGEKQVNLRNEHNRKVRELNRLSAWAWDSRVKDHPPNKEVYGPINGKRQRKQVHGDVTSFFESHPDEKEISVAEQQKVASEWSSDDDLPLFGDKILGLGGKDTNGTAIIPDSQDSEE